MADEVNNNNEVDSPCRAICQLDDNDEYCIGCYRTNAEIERWQKLSNVERQKIVDALPERRARLED